MPELSLLYPRGGPLTVVVGVAILRFVVESRGRCAPTGTPETGGAVALTAAAGIGYYSGRRRGGRASPGAARFRPFRGRPVRTEGRTGAGSEWRIRAHGPAARAERRLCPPVAGTLTGGEWCVRTPGASPGGAHGVARAGCRVAFAGRGSASHPVRAQITSKQGPSGPMSASLILAQEQRWRRA